MYRIILIYMTYILDENQPMINLGGELKPFAPMFLSNIQTRIRLEFECNHSSCDNAVL